MKLTDILKVNSICTGMKGEGKTKMQVIHEMIDHLATAFDLTEMQKEAVEEAITYRERQKSTGMERGVAIPHGKTEQVKGLIASFGVYGDGIDFDSLDKRPAQFIVCMVSDFDRSTEHVQALAQIMRILQREDVAQEMLAAGDGKKVMSLLRREEKELGRM
ncbi:MAG: PTS sugar transporter subunit IIA [Planctomycetota bacterium]|jgi:mannitol/fructose-specific phosphotransferase system IIA component (Ntr-type)